MELWRLSNGMAVAPDDPIWMSAGKVAEGTLAEMVEKFTRLPYSHQRSHVLRGADGTEAYDAGQIRDLAKDPRFSG